MYKFYFYQQCESTHKCTYTCTHKQQHINTHTISHPHTHTQSCKTCVYKLSSNKFSHTYFHDHCTNMVAMVMLLPTRLLWQCCYQHVCYGNAVTMSPCLSINMTMYLIYLRAYIYTHSIINGILVHT